VLCGLWTSLCVFIVVCLQYIVLLNAQYYYYQGLATTLTGVRSFVTVQNSKRERPRSEDGHWKTSSTGGRPHTLPWSGEDGALLPEEVEGKRISFSR
jgi:hypothetical protein